MVNSFTMTIVNSINELLEVLPRFILLQSSLMNLIEECSNSVTSQNNLRLPKCQSHSCLLTAIEGFSARLLSAQLNIIKLIQMCRVVSLLTKAWPRETCSALLYHHHREHFSMSGRLHKIQFHEKYIRLLPTLVTAIQLFLS